MTQVTVLTGRDRRSNWSLDDRHRILTAAFAPGAVISEIARQFDIASSMIYKWRRQAVAANRALAFVPAVVAQAESPPSIVPPEPPTPSPSSAPVAITVEFSAGVKVVIDATAPTSLVTATLLALQ
jgi:transposase